MHYSSFGSESNVGSGPSQTFQGSQTRSGTTTQDLIRIFNTALVATKASEGKDASQEVFELVQSPAFRAILTAVRDLARESGIPEREAAERLIGTFRKLDTLWTQYLCHEGAATVLRPKS